MKKLIYQTIRKQKGAALIVLVLAFIMATSVLVITNYSIDKGRIGYEKRTTESLAKAKEALISYAVTYGEYLTTTNEPKSGMLGFLPCPVNSSSTNEGVTSGSCGNQYQSNLGRLPWKTLGIEPLKDASGNCLWYAVSSEYKSIGRIDRDELINFSGLARSEMLNEDSNGSFEVFDEGAVKIIGNTASERPVAIIIAPGGPVAGQNRTFDNTTHCGGDYTANRFLELFNGIDNSSITTSDDFIDDFITSSLTTANNFNDRVTVISQSEIFDEIKRQSDFITDVESTTQLLAECMADFGRTNPPAAGGCNVAACPGCNLNNCQQSCRGTRTTCRTNCQTQWQTCRDNATNKSERDVCNAQRTICRDACDATQTSCEADCVTDCSSAGGNDFRLPWPAPLSLADYRVSTSYIENTADVHLGRYPVEVSVANGVTGNPGGPYLIENDTAVDPQYTNCAILKTNSMGTYNSIERRIWQNWKDHFFYAVGSDFDLNATAPTSPDPCSSCITVTGSADEYAAIVIFSGSRLNSLNQSRNVSPPDVVDEKQNINNYLEDENQVDDGNYKDGPSSATFNDIAYCIDEALNVTRCVP